MLNLSCRVLVNFKQRVRNDSKRFLFVSSQWRCATEADPVNEAFLMKLFDIRYTAATDLIKYYPKYKKLPRSTIVQNYNLCAENGFSNAHILDASEILLVKPFYLEQRFLFYKELGCMKILPPMIVLFTNTTRLSVRDLKGWKVMQADQNVVENILKHIPGTPTDVPQFNSLNDDSSVIEIHNLCKWQFLKWKLEFTDKQFHEISSHEVFISIRGLSTFRRLIEIFETEFGFPKAKMRRYFHLLLVNLHSVEELLKKFEQLGDIGQKQLIQRYPRLLRVEAKEIQNRIDTLIDIGIPPKSITMYPDILGLPKETIIKKTKNFKSVPELQRHWYHPRILNLIYYIERVKKRLPQLREHKMKCISFYLLTCDHASYARYIADGDFRTRGKDLMTFLNYELGNFEIIHTKLQRHAMWCQVPLANSYDTFHYLKERNYSNDDILRNIPIVLYYRPTIEKELDKIHTEEMYQSLELTSSQELAMCLYNMEKKHHFSGHGVFDYKLDENTAFEIEKN